MLKDRILYPKCIIEPFTELYVGQYGCNPPQKLLSMYLEQMKLEIANKNVKAVVFLGDLAPHTSTGKMDQKLSDSDKREVYYHLKSLIYNT